MGFKKKKKTRLTKKTVSLNKFIRFPAVKESAFVVCCWFRLIFSCVVFGVIGWTSNVDIKRIPQKKQTRQQACNNRL